MRTRSLFLIAGFLFVLLPGCHKEHSDEGGKKSKTNPLPSDYPFATGYCDGVSLGIPIPDTIYYLPVSTGPLPVSLLLDMPAAGNQGSQGSCSAWATIYGAGTHYMHFTTAKPYSDTGNLSPKFTYNQITKGDCKCTAILEHLYLLKTYGASSLQLMPYDARECAIQPDSLQKARAEPYKIKGWQKVNLHDPALIKRAVLEHKPVIFAITTDDGFQQIAAPYIWKSRVGSIGQPHAMVITGYDDNKNAFRIMNSWSTAWGDDGFAWIDFDFFMTNVLEGGYIII
ncbi:MAG: C1 family peptidase [Ferruginibacter sp.]